MIFLFFIHSALCSVFYYNKGENKFFDEYIESKDNLVSGDRLYYGERINITLGEIVDYGSDIDPSDPLNYLCFISIINNTYFVSEVEYHKFPWYSNQSTIYQQSISELTLFTDNKHICSKIIYQGYNMIIYCQIETTPEIFENFFIQIKADGQVEIIQAPGFNDQAISQLLYWPQQKIISQIQSGDITNFDETIDVISMLNLNGSLIQLKNISNYQAALFENQLALEINNKTIIENITCKGKPKDIGGHIQNLYIACDQLYNFGSDSYINLNISKIETTEYYLILDNKYILEMSTNRYFTSQYPIYAAGYGDYALVIQKDGVYPVVINEISIFNPTGELTVNDDIKFFPVDYGLMALNASKVFDQIPLAYEDFVYGPLPEIDPRSGLTPQAPIEVINYKELSNVKAAIQIEDGLIGLNQDPNNDLVLFGCTIEFQCGPQSIIDQNVKNISWAQFYVDDDNVLYLVYADSNHIKLFKNQKTKTLLMFNYSNIAFDSNLLALFNNNTLVILYIDENAEYIALNDSFQHSIKQLVIDDYQVYVIFEDFYIVYELSYDEYLDVIDAEYHDIPNITFAHAQDGQLILFNSTSFQSLYDGYERGVYRFNFENKTFKRTSEFIYFYGQEQLIIMDPDMSQSFTGQLTYITRQNTTSDSIFVEYDDYIMLISNGSFYLIELDLKFMPMSLNFSADYYYKTQNTSLNFTNILNQTASSELQIQLPVIPVMRKSKVTVNITNGTGQLNVRDVFTGNVKKVQSDNPNVTLNQLYQLVKQFDKQVRDILTISNQSLILYDKNITTQNKSLPMNISCSQLEPYLNGFLIICQNITIYVHSIELNNFTLHNISLSKQIYQINQQYIGLINNKSLTVHNITNEIGTLKDVDSYTFDGSDVVVLRKNELSICDINLKCSQVFNLSTFGFEYTLVQNYKNKTFFIFTPKGINHLIQIDQDIKVVKSFSGSYKSTPFEIHIYGDILKVCYYEIDYVSAYFYDITTNSSVIPYIDSQIVISESGCGKDYSNNSFVINFKDSNTSQSQLFQYSVSNKIQLAIKSQSVKNFSLKAVGDVKVEYSTIQLNYLNSNNVIVPKEKTSDDLILTILTAFVVFIVVILIIRQVRKWYLIRKMNSAGQAKPSEFNSEYL